MNPTISVYELQKLIDGGSVYLIDVLLPEDFACRHISGAENACIYEMAFLNRIEELVPNRDTVVVVYDDTGTTLAARTAREKLIRAGYGMVSVLEGGLQSWLAAGFKVRSSPLSLPPAMVHDGIYRIDADKSVVEWIGRNINNRHLGRIAISDGEVFFANNRLVSGCFELDMNTISNLDIQDEGWRNTLVAHLKSEDFFDVERYPTATFELNRATLIADSTPGTSNYEIAGLLMIKDMSRSICFPAIIAAQDDGSIKAQSTFDVDRTLWNVCYGSGKLFERLGMHLVNDMINIELFIVARNDTNRGRI